MVMVKAGTDEFFIDGLLLKNLDFVKKKVLSNNDFMVAILDGRPGSGKSTLMHQMAHYLNDGKTKLENTTFTMEDFAERLKKAKKGDVIVLDEGFSINKRTTQSAANMEILGLLQQVRMKQIFVLIALPYVYDLDKNLILGLCDFFIHVYRKDFGPRGFYQCFDRLRLKKLWLNCRQSYSYSQKIAPPNFFARFSRFFPLDYDQYEAKKARCLEQMREDGGVAKNRYQIQRDKLIYGVHETIGAPKIMEITGMKKSQVYNIIDIQRKLEEKNGR